jgi:UDP-glucose 4-epimerase
VRYGNVIGSRGSVIPLLIDQRAGGASLTLTDERMTRFFLTLDQACDVVFAALADGRPGEVWVPRIGAARMIDVIEAVRGSSSSEVVVTGMRPGEKLHEELVSDGEAARTVEHGDYLIIQPLLPELGARDQQPVDAACTSENVDLDIDAVARLIADAGLGEMR